MKKTNCNEKDHPRFHFFFLKIFFLLLPAIFSAQGLQPASIGGSAWLTASQARMTDPSFPERATEMNGWGFSEGIGLSVRARMRSVYSLAVQTCFETAGTGGTYYYSTADPDVFVRVHDRYTFLSLNAGLRMQSDGKVSGFYFEPGAFSRVILATKVKRVNGPSQPAPGSIILDAADHETFTFGVCAALGKNFGEKADVELNAFYDLSSAVSRNEVKVFLMTTSLTVRYYFTRPAE